MNQNSIATDIAKYSCCPPPLSLMYPLTKSSSPSLFLLTKASSRTTTTKPSSSVVGVEEEVSALSSSSSSGASIVTNSSIDNINSFIVIDNNNNDNILKQLSKQGGFDEMIYDISKKIELLPSPVLSLLNKATIKSNNSATTATTDLNNTIVTNANEVIMIIDNDNDKHISDVNSPIPNMTVSSSLSSSKLKISNRKKRKGSSKKASKSIIHQQDDTENTTTTTTITNNNKSDVDSGAVANVHNLNTVSNGDEQQIKQHQQQDNNNINNHNNSHENIIIKNVVESILSYVCRQLKRSLSNRIYNDFRKAQLFFLQSNNQNKYDDIIDPDSKPLCLFLKKLKEKNLKSSINSTTNQQKQFQPLQHLQAQQQQHQSHQLYKNSDCGGSSSSSCKTIGIVDNSIASNNNNSIPTSSNKNHTLHEKEKTRNKKNDMKNVLVDKNKNPLTSLGKRGRYYLDILNEQEYLNKYQDSCSNQSNHISSIVNNGNNSSYNNNMFKIEPLLDWHDLFADWYSDNHDGFYREWLRNQHVLMRFQIDKLNKNKKFKNNSLSAATSNLLICNTVDPIIRTLSNSSTENYNNHHNHSYNYQNHNQILSRIIPPPVPVSIHHPACWGIKARITSYEDIILRGNKKLSLTFDINNINNKNLFSFIHPASYSSTIVIPVHKKSSTSSSVVTASSASLKVMKQSQTSNRIKTTTDYHQQQHHHHEHLQQEENLNSASTITSVANNKEILNSNTSSLTLASTSLAISTSDTANVEDKRSVSTELYPTIASTVTPTTAAAVVNVGVDGNMLDYGEKRSSATDIITTTTVDNKNDNTTIVDSNNLTGNTTTTTATTATTIDNNPIPNSKDDHDIDDYNIYVHHIQQELDILEAENFLKLTRLNEILNLKKDVEKLRTKRKVLENLFYDAICKNEFACGEQNLYSIKPSENSLFDYDLSPVNNYNNDNNNHNNRGFVIQDLLTLKNTSNIENNHNSSRNNSSSNTILPDLNRVIDSSSLNSR